MHSSPENRVLQSGDLMIYPRSGQVEIQGHSIRLGLVNMQVLLTLLERAGDVVSRTELFERVWKNQTISDDTLTRCISELRTLLGKHSSHQHLIETLPKRGYRWVLAVDDETSLEVKSLPQRLGSSVGRLKRTSIAVSVGLVSLLLFTMLTLWLIDILLQPELERIALIPVYADQPGQRALAADLDDMLRDHLLATEDLRFIAHSALAGDQESAFAYPTRDINVQWIIEGNIREKRGVVRVSLSLVDAKTALVIYTLTQDVDNDPQQVEKLSLLFIDEVLRIVHLN